MPAKDNTGPLGTGPVGLGNGGCKVHMDAPEGVAFGKGLRRHAGKGKGTGQNCGCGHGKGRGRGHGHQHGHDICFHDLGSKEAIEAQIRFLQERLETLNTGA